uniref:PRELI/MSF1 domain-containing protein n=1 Tax=Spongospora subterranea TaxID=70186 RepID=A0A0H5QIH2_9EUKA|eukprot:CRZ01778.1 hypothetical protein [Spongospora subterranea]
MREAKLLHTYKEPWHLVIQAYQQRFENLPHPRIPALLGAEFDNFAYEPSSQELSWVVLGQVDVPVASWVKKLSGCSHCIFRTINTINYSARTLKIRITNDDFRHIAVVEESNCFRVHPENDQWTEYEQVSRLTIRSLLGMQSQVEGIVMKSYSENYEAGRSVDNEFIQKLLGAGHLPRRGYLEAMTVAHLNEGATIPFTHMEHSITALPYSAKELDIESEDDSQINQPDAVKLHHL